jgi:glycosyltransferase involved in cell wall biosynthesis
MLVAIPSKGRAGSVKTLTVTPTAVLYVPQAEESWYRSYYRETAIVPIPDEIRGITRTRNWILDHVDERYVVFVDDDVEGVGYWDIRYTGKRKVVLSEEQLMKEWLRLFHVTDDLGYHLWGAETTGDYRVVHPHRPFVWHSYVTASCMGLVNDGIRFDPEFPVKEDYELCLRCIRDDGGIVGARYLFWKNSHWATEGGCKDYRTQEMEDEAIRKLMQMYPNRIKKITKGGSQYSIRLDF